MNRKFYLVLFVVLMALAATGLYARHRAKAAAIAVNCDTPAPPAPQAAPPPDLPGFAVEPACGTGAEAPNASKAPPTGKTGKAK